MYSQVSEPFDVDFRPSAELAAAKKTGKMLCFSILFTSAKTEKNSDTRI